MQEYVGVVFFLWRRAVEVTRPFRRHVDEVARRYDILDQIPQRSVVPLISEGAT